MRGRAISLVLATLLPAAGSEAFALFPPQSGPSVATRLAEAARWSAVSGLADGLQVAVEPGFAADLGAVTPADRAAIEQAVSDALAMWETPALAFDPSFEDPGAVEGTGVGREIDVFAVPSTHPVFLGTDFFGFTATSRYLSASRPLTNGQSAPGWVTERADVYLNKDLLLSVANLFGFTQQQRLDALTRLVAHEVGHALGLGHPNGNDPYGVTSHYDLDGDPANPIVIDAEDPFAGFGTSALRDDAAIMSNRPCGNPFVAPCAALFDTALHADDAGGRDVLYPAVLPVAPGAVVVSGPAYVAVSDPASGATDLLFSGAPLTAGDGVAIDPMGDVLVADSGSGAIHRIDAETGVASVVASGGSLLVPNRIVVGPDGTIYVVDVGLGGAIVAVNPDTGASAVLAVVPDAFDLAIDRAGSALHVAAGDAVVRVALPGGSQSVLASGGLMSVNLGIGVEAGGDLVVLTYVNGTFTHRLVRVSADGSTQTALHTSAPNTGYYDLALDGEGAALVADAGGNAAVRVDLATGIAETVDALEFPFGVTAVLPRCDDGLDNDADGAWDAAGAAADAGCTGPADPWEFELGRTCDDGLDNDGDGWEDFRIDGSGDPGCRLASSATENPQCQDGIDNDGKPGIDFDGGASRNGGVPLADPDPQCTEPWRTRERASGCGLGFELALLLPLLGRRRRAA